MASPLSDVSSILMADDRLESEAMLVLDDRLLRSVVRKRGGDEERASGFQFGLRPLSFINLALLDVVVFIEDFNFFVVTLVYVVTHQIKL
jgi:hypothetical protein